METASRSVFPRGRDTAPLLAVLSLVPAGAFGVAILDDRAGFRLFMSAAGLAMLVLVLGLGVRRRALRTGEIRISAEGTLRFRPSGVLMAMDFVVPLVLGLPALARAVVSLCGLPMMAGLTRFTTLSPYVLGALALGLLARALLGLCTPAGLRVDARGLHGVRGATVLDIPWDELDRSAPVGRSGPRVSFVTRAGGGVVVDAHYLGSDPALVAQIVEYYRTRPAERALLADGVAAVQAVQAVERGRG